MIAPTIVTIHKVQEPNWCAYLGDSAYITSDRIIVHLEIISVVDAAVLLSEQRCGAQSRVQIHVA